MSSKIIAFGYVTQRSTFVFASVVNAAHCKRINRITLMAVAPSGEYQRSLYLSLRSLNLWNCVHLFLSIHMCLTCSQTVSFSSNYIICPLCPSPVTTPVPCATCRSWRWTQSGTISTRKLRIRRCRKNTATCNYRSCAATATRWVQRSRVCHKVRAEVTCLDDWHDAFVDTIVPSIVPFRLSEVKHYILYLVDMCINGHQCSV